MSADIQFETAKHLGIITLTRVSALNALTLAMIEAMARQLTSWQTNPDIHAIVLTAEGKAFCAGGDVRWLYETGQNNPREVMSFFWQEYRLNYAISQCTKPYIALMDGICMGGGVGISLHGNCPVASDRFVFAMPETGIGLFPDIGASFLLSRVKAPLGLYLALTGRRVAAQDALDLGLVKHLLDHDIINELLPRLRELDLSEDAPAKVEAFFALAARAPETAALGKEMAAINHYFNKDSLAAIFQGLASSNDPWATDTLAILEKCSPLSLEITFEQINRAKSLSLVECLKMDYALVGHFMRGRDFYEGIRAMLVDKDKNPHWQPASLDKVSTQMVADYFECEEALVL